MPRAPYITDEIAAVLQAAETEGRELRLSTQLDRRLYKRVDEVLATLGGTWNRKAKAHLFADDAAAAILAALGLNDGVAVPQETSAERIKRLQFYETRATYADRMAAWAVRPGCIVLEPSAGMGSLVASALNHGARQVVAVDVDEQHAEVLRNFPNTRVICGDFLDLADGPLMEEAQTTGGFDAILMNPPFRANQDIRHVLAAARFLNPGGRMAAITSPHFTFANDREGRDFRARIERRGVRVEDIPPGSFDGTDVGARLLYIEREAA